MWGLDLLGLAKYPKVGIKHFPEGWALGVFSNTFGDSRPAVDALLTTGKCRLVRVQLMWKDNHDFKRNDFPKIVEEAKKWIPLMVKYPWVIFQFSGACEHKLSEPLALELARMIREVFPFGVDYVNTPMKGGAILTQGGRIINEVHGNKAKRPTEGRFNFSFDGSPAVDSNVTQLKREFAESQAFFLWEPRFNGRWEDNDTTPRPKRKGWPDAKLIKSIIALSRECGEVSLPKKWIYKSHSENHGKKDKRAEKPVMIAPIKVKEILFKTRELGEVVHRLRYYGPYEGGGYRYYATKWGFEIGQNVLEVWAGGKMYGKVNASFRCGTFR